jgi:hypothetical protein
MTKTLEAWSRSAEEGTTRVVDLDSRLWQSLERGSEVQYRRVSTDFYETAASATRIQSFTEFHPSSSQTSS